MSENVRIILTEAAQRTPGRPHPSTIWRWCRKGVKSRSGRRIKLEHIRVGGRIFTTPSALDRFFKEVAVADAEHFDNLPTSTAAPSRRPCTPTQRQRAIAAAERKLDEAGI
jgi:hypothetical protein